MGLQVDGGGHKSPQKMVTIIPTPDYIPTINTSNLLNTASSVSKSENASKQWGRVKKVADIFNERDLIHGQEGGSSENEEGIKKRYTAKDIQKVANMFMRSKQAVKKVRAKYSARALKMLHHGNSSSMLDLTDIAGYNIDKDMFSTYDLADMHQKLRKQKHLRLAILQQKFLDELPALRELSVKDHLGRKIDALQRIKCSDYVQGGSGAPALDNVGKMSERSESSDASPGTRRQSRLRQSIDLSASNLFARIRQQHDDDVFDDVDSGGPLPNGLSGLPTVKKSVPLTVADVDRELAVSKSRERIESDLNLPVDRIARFAVLRANVTKINGKFRKLVRGTNRGDAEMKADDNEDEETKQYIPSRFTSTGMAKRFFRKYARIVLIVTQWIDMIMNKRYDFERELKSFVDIANDIEDQVISSTMHEFGLSFDKKFFKANKEISLSSEVRKILTTRWQYRTPAMVKQVINGLQSLRSLSEYPVQTQEKLCKVAWYQTIGPKKPIVRQGHHAESFYFILSGTAFVKKMIQDPVTGESKVQVAARLTKGHSFGEIGLLFDTLRTATVESATPMELLVIGKEDFVRIFMKAENPDDEPDHIKFLRKVPFMCSWPMDVLKLEAGACLTHYFKRGTLITDNDRHSEWIYFIMSGTCEVLKKLKAVKGRDPRELRPKSNPMSDVILPELGMPNNHAKIDSGRSRPIRRSIHPEVLNEMTAFYESLRQKYQTKTSSPEPVRIELPKDDVMPDQAERQKPKVFHRTAVSATVRKFSSAEDNGKVKFLEGKQKTEGDIKLHNSYKMLPLATNDETRPSSRARFDEAMSVTLQPGHFRLPSREQLTSIYRPKSEGMKPVTQPPADDVFLQVEILHPKDCFGLNTLKYVMDEDEEVFDVEGGEETPILSLVSRGAEVIMLSKKVFLKYADQKCKLRVRNMIKVYPAENVMQENMQLEADWSTYKECLLSQYMERKNKHNLLNTRSKSTVR